MYAYEVADACGECLDVARLLHIDISVVKGNLIDKAHAWFVSENWFYPH